MFKVIAELVAVFITVDGTMEIDASMDEYGFIQAKIHVNGKEWEDQFSDVEELKEFIKELPIKEVIDITEYQYDLVAS